MPLLLLLVVGLIEFGRAYHAQISLTAAAREGARSMAVLNSTEAAVSATRNAAPTLALTAGQVQVAPTTCTPGADVTVRVTYPLRTLTRLVVQQLTLRSHAVMRCGG